MKKLFLLTALFVAAAFPSCSKHDGVETPDLPDPQPLAIAFAEGNSLQFESHKNIYEPTRKQRNSYAE